MARQDVTLTIGGNFRPALEGTNRFAKQAQGIIRKQRLSVDIDTRKSELALGRITGKADEFTKSLEASNARVIAFGASVAVIEGMRRAFKAMLGTVIDVEQRLNRINALLKNSANSLSNFSDELFKVARNTQQSFALVSDAALELARQGLSTEETLNRLNSAMILSRVSGLDAANAVDGLTAILNGLDRQVLNSTQVINKLIAVETSFAVSSNDLVEALSRSAASAQDANVSFDQLLGLITAIKQRTGLGGATIGQGIKTIFTRLESRGTLDSLRELGVEIDATQGGIEKLIEVTRAANAASPVDAAQIRELAAGKFQINKLSAAIADLSGNYSIMKNATEAANLATNQGIMLNEQLNESMAAISNRIATNMSQVFVKIGEGGVGDVMRDVLKVIEDVSSAILGLEQKTSTVLGDMIRNLREFEIAGIGVAEVLKGVVSVATGPALPFILAAITNVLTKTAIFAGKALITLTHLSGAKKRELETQAAINSLLSKANGEDMKRLNAAKTMEQRQQVILSIMERQLAVQNLIASRGMMASQAMIKSGLSMSMEGGLLSRSLTRKGSLTRTAAGGILPAIGKETRDINNGIGGASKGATPKVIKDFSFGQGRTGPVVANTDEFLVKNYQGSGADAIFNQDMVKKMGLPSGAQRITENIANGFIPNLAKGRHRSSRRKLTQHELFQQLEDEYGGKAAMSIKESLRPPQIHQDIDRLVADIRNPESFRSLQKIVNQHPLGIAGLQGEGKISQQAVSTITQMGGLGPQALQKIQRTKIFQLLEQEIARGATVNPSRVKSLQAAIKKHPQGLAGLQSEGAVSPTLISHIDKAGGASKISTRAFNAIAKQQAQKQPSQATVAQPASAPDTSRMFGPPPKLPARPPMPPSANTGGGPSAEYWQELKAEQVARMKEMKRLESMDFDQINAESQGMGGSKSKGGISSLSGKALQKYKRSVNRAASTITRSEKDQEAHNIINKSVSTNAKRITRNQLAKINNRFIEAHVNQLGLGIKDFDRAQAKVQAGIHTKAEKKLVEEVARATKGHSSEIMQRNMEAVREGTMISAQKDLQKLEAPGIRNLRSRLFVNPQKRVEEIIKQSNRAGGSLGEEQKRNLRERASSMQQQRMQRMGSAAMIGGIGLSLASPAVGKLVGEKFGDRAGGATEKAMQFAGAGAATGFLLGPKGAMVGAAGGAILGLYKALSQPDSKLKEMKAAYEDLTETFQKNQNAANGYIQAQSQINNLIESGKFSSVQILELQRRGMDALSQITDASVRAELAATSDPAKREEILNQFVRREAGEQRRKGVELQLQEVIERISFDNGKITSAERQELPTSLLGAVDFNEVVESGDKYTKEVSAKTEELNQFVRKNFETLFKGEDGVLQQIRKEQPSLGTFDTAKILEEKTREINSQFEGKVKDLASSLQIPLENLPENIGFENILEITTLFSKAGVKYQQTVRDMMLQGQNTNLTISRADLGANMMRSTNLGMQDGRLNDMSRFLASQLEIEKQKGQLKIAESAGFVNQNAVDSLSLQALAQQQEEANINLKRSISKELTDALSPAVGRMSDPTKADAMLKSLQNLEFNGVSELQAIKDSLKEAGIKDKGLLKTMEGLLDNAAGQLDQLEIQNKNAQANLLQNQRIERAIQLTSRLRNAGLSVVPETPNDEIRSLVAKDVPNTTQSRQKAGVGRLEDATKFVQQGVFEEIANVLNITDEIRGNMSPAGRVRSILRTGRAQIEGRRDLSPVDQLKELENRVPWEELMRTDSGFAAALRNAFASGYANLGGLNTSVSQNPALAKERERMEAEQARRRSPTQKDPNETQIEFQERRRLELENIAKRNLDQYKGKTGYVSSSMMESSPEKIRESLDGLKEELKAARRGKSTGDLTYTDYGIKRREREIEAMEHLLTSKEARLEMSRFDTSPQVTETQRRQVDAEASVVSSISEFASSAEAMEAMQTLATSLGDSVEANKKILEQMAAISQTQAEIVKQGFDIKTDISNVFRIEMPDGAIEQFQTFEAVIAALQETYKEMESRLKAVERSREKRSPTPTGT